MLAVDDDRPRNEVEWVLAGPAVADIAIFRGGQRERFVEATEIEKGLAGERQVVGSEEMGDGGGVVVEIGDEKLAGLAEDVVFGSGMDSASEGGGGMGDKGPLEG